MAIRIRLTAMQNVATDELRSRINVAMGGDNHFLYGESDGWSWCLARVWTMGGEVFDAIAADAQHSVLQLTTSDGSVWYMKLQAPSQEPLTFVHPFVYLDAEEIADAAEDYDDEEEDDYDEDDYDLFDNVAGLDRDNQLTAFLWDDEEEARQRREADDEADPHLMDSLIEEVNSYGMEVPADLERQWRKLSTSDAAASFFQWQADLMVEALTSARISFDENVLRGVFKIDGLTDDELDSDLGNLPRFCEALGITGWFTNDDDDEDDEYDDDSEDEAEEELEFEDAPWTQQVLGQVSEASLHAITGGPVSLPVTSLGDLFRIVWFTNTHTTLVLRIRPPEGDQVPLSFIDLPYVEWTHNDGNWYLATREPQLLIMGDRRGNDFPLDQMLKQLPTGTELEMLTASGDIESGNQRYLGRIENGSWLIEHSSIELSAADLQEALQVSALSHNDEPIPIPLNERERTMALIDEESLFDHEPITETEKGFEYAGDLREWLLRIVFRARFQNRNVWDVDAHAEAVREQTEQLEMAFAGIFPQETQAETNTGVLLYEGVRRYFEADLGTSGMTDPQWLKRSEGQLADVGFALIGDLSCEKLPGFIIRAYAGPGDCHAHITKGPMGHSLEFFTVFDDDSSLTTNDGTSEASYPKSGIYFRSYDDLSVEALLAKHRDGIERFQRHKQTAPTEHRGDLVQAAQQLDEYMNRHPTLSKL